MLLVTIELLFICYWLLWSYSSYIAGYYGVTFHMLLVTMELLFICYCLLWSYSSYVTGYYGVTLHMLMVTMELLFICYWLLWSYSSYVTGYNGVTLHKLQVIIELLFSLLNTSPKPLTRVKMMLASVFRLELPTDSSDAGFLMFLSFRLMVLLRS